MLLYIALALTLAGIIIIGVLLARNWSAIRLIDTQANVEQTRDEIIKRRIKRQLGTSVEKLYKKTLAPGVKGMRKVGAKLFEKLEEVERSYQQQQRVGRKNLSDPKLVESYLEEADAFLQDGDHGRAEKRLIDIISIDQKNVSAYEMLGRLYMQKREYDLAEETFSFLVKLAPDDASVHAYMGEVLEQKKNVKGAKKFYAKAVKLSPKNPKYLDFAIQNAISLGEKSEALDYLRSLKEANPENRKIEQLEKDIANITST
jgi:tetratricopeptide (TPR) repeat protein